MRSAYEAGYKVITLTDCCAATRCVSQRRIEASSMQGLTAKVLLNVRGRFVCPQSASTAAFLLLERDDKWQRDGGQCIQIHHC